MLHIETITHFLNHFFAIERYEQKEDGIYHPTQRTVTRIGLALEPHSELTHWIQTHQLDAIFLHRPWKLDIATLPPYVGVFSYHLAFDETLTLGYNQRLADLLLMRELQIFGTKAGRPIGMIGITPETTLSQYSHSLKQIFGGLDQQQVHEDATINKIAVVGAMTDNLVRDAAKAEVALYLTGQMRKPALQAVEDRGLNVIAVGHRRCEEWGLQALAGVLRERFCSLEVMVFDTLKS
jgi:putative NIF3 family GTP cyclohydrolase 1 type 2